LLPLLLLHKSHRLSTPSLARALSLLRPRGLLLFLLQLLLLLLPLHKKRN
jgi:hypothetical protein